MKIKVLFFASARELVGQSMALIDIQEEIAEGAPSSASVGALLRLLFEQFPRLTQSVATLSVALNRSYLPRTVSLLSQEAEDTEEIHIKLARSFDSVSLKEGDEVALLPPISGG